MGKGGPGSACGHTRVTAIWQQRLPNWDAVNSSLSERGSGRFVYLPRHGGQFWAWGSKFGRQSMQVMGRGRRSVITLYLGVLPIGINRFRLCVAPLLRVRSVRLYLCSSERSARANVAEGR